MKKDIHPKTHQCKVTCACGNTFTIGSTQKKIDVEICSKCHPFYTGKQKLVDSARRVEKFKEKTAKKEAASKGVKGRKIKRQESKARKKDKDIEIINKKNVRIKKTKKDKK